MQKNLFSVIAATLFFLFPAANADALQPLVLEGLHVSYGEGAEVLMALLDSEGDFPWSGITMEPGTFGVSGEIVSPRRLFPGTTSATIRIRSGEERVQSMVVRLSWHAPMVTARSSIARGDTITPEMIQVEVAPYKRSYGRVFPETSSILGKRASRNIRAGDAVSERDIERILLVERRDPVVIISKSGMVTSRLKGVALEGGDRGERITVRIPKFRNDISALVIDQGLVQVIDDLPQ